MSNWQTTPVKRALAACRGAFWAVALFSLAINLLMLAAPLYMMQVFDRVLASRSIETLIALTVVTAGAFLALALLEIVRSRVLLRISTRLGRSLSGEALSAAVGGALQGAGHGVQGSALPCRSHVVGSCGEVWGKLGNTRDFSLSQPFAT